MLLSPPTDVHNTTVTMRSGVRFTITNTVDSKRDTNIIDDRKQKRKEMNTKRSAQHVRASPCGLVEGMRGRRMDKIRAEMTSMFVSLLVCE